MPKLRLITLTLLALSAATAVHAEEKRYVSDELNTWVRSGPGDNYRLVGTINAGEEVAVMINGLGATPLQELYLFNNAVSSFIEAKGLKIYRTFVGNFMTAIDMAGASISILRLDAETKALLDAAADTPALKI